MARDNRIDMAICRRCSGRFPLDDEGVCPLCRDYEEQQVATLTSGWNADLALLERFEAFYAERAPHPTFEAGLRRRQPPGK
jgi:hypothetical protein